MRELPGPYDPQSSLFSTFEDNILLELANRGDDCALNTLINRYKGFVKIKARSFFLIGADKEDIVQEGMIGLYKAIRDFDDQKNASFKSFAELCVTRQIITAIKTATRNKHSLLNNYVSLNRPIYNEEESEQHLIDVLNDVGHIDPIDQIVRGDEVKEIREACACLLSNFEKQVLSRYLDGYSYDEIAQSLNRRIKAIDNALQRIKRKVETYMSENNAKEA